MSAIVALSPTATAAWKAIDTYRRKYGFMPPLRCVCVELRHQGITVYNNDMHTPIQEIIDAGLMTPRAGEWFLRTLMHDPQLRAAVAAKTDGTCWYCGINASESPRFGIDHVVSISEGGDNRLENLVPCCQSCNASKIRREQTERRKPARPPAPSAGVDEG